MSKREFSIGTRGSELALAQARRVQEALASRSGAATRLRIIKTAGDTIDDRPFREMPGRGFFTKELEDALLLGRIDLAVHSLKDLMTTQPAGLKIGAVCSREDRRELLVMRKEARARERLLLLAPGAVVGTSSARRACQIEVHDPSLQIKDLRGNVPTRIRKLREGMYDAIVIAAAGVKRLNLELADLDILHLDPEFFLPAPGQGSLAIELRENDLEAQELVSDLGTEQEATEAALERGLLARFESGCSLPLGVYSEVRGETYRLKAVLGQRSGEKWFALKEADVTGDDIERVINAVYGRLTGRCD